MLDGRRARTSRPGYPAPRRSASSPLVSRCTGFAHCHSPFGEFLPLKLGECAAGQDGWQHTERLKISAERLAAHNPLSLAAKGLCHVGRQLRRRKYAPPSGGLKAAIARLSDGGNVGQYGGTL